jgi:hypothetical protein
VAPRGLPKPYDRHHKPHFESPVATQRRHRCAKIARHVRRAVGAETSHAKRGAVQYADDEGRSGGGAPGEVDGRPPDDLQIGAYHDVLATLALIAGRAQLLMARLGGDLELSAQRDLAELLHGVRQAEMHLALLRAKGTPPSQTDLDARTARTLLGEAADARSGAGEFALAELMCLLMQASLDALGSTGGDLDLVAERTDSGWELRAVLHPPGGPVARGPIDRLWRLHLCAIVAERLGGHLSLQRHADGVSYVIRLPVTWPQEGGRTT